MSSERIYREALLGKKIGMSHVFTEEGECVPVTLLQTGPCVVLNVKTKERDGYSAVQFGFEPKKQQRCNKAERGHFGKAGQGAFAYTREVRCDVDTLQWNAPGKEIRVGDVFNNGEFVDVCGYTKGRGFSGVVRRWSMGGFPATRGTHETRRHGGSVGCRKFPGHIFKNKRMPGRYGNERVTVQNLQVVGIKPEMNLLMVRGGVPGPNGSIVVVRKANKRSGAAVAASA